MINECGNGTCIGPTLSGQHDAFTNHFQLTLTAAGSGVLVGGPELLPRITTGQNFDQANRYLRANWPKESNGCPLNPQSNIFFVDLEVVLTYDFGDIHSGAQFH